MRALALWVFGSLPVAAATVVVHPGQSIQSAVDRARPGDMVVVRAGTCVSTHSSRLHGATVRGFTVRGFSQDGIFLLCADGIVVEGNTAIDNAEYGIFPSHVAGGRVAGNHASGANDTGIYIGQSRDVRVEGNVAQANVSGFEVENSSGVTVRHNLATGNTAGFLSFTLPGLDIHVNEANTIEDNVSVFNNKKNTCTDPADSVCLVPAGTGILALAVDGNVIRRNVVAGNGSFGIALSDFCSAEQVPDDVCKTLDIDPLPDGNRIVDNVVLRNGLKPDPRLPAGLNADLVWTGAGSGNCWSRNLAGTVSPVRPLPVCP